MSFWTWRARAPLSRRKRPNPYVNWSKLVEIHARKNALYVQEICQGAGIRRARASCNAKYQSGWLVTVQSVFPCLDFLIIHQFT